LIDQNNKVEVVGCSRLSASFLYKKKYQKIKFYIMRFKIIEAYLIDLLKNSVIDILMI